MSFSPKRSMVLQISVFWNFKIRSFVKRKFFGLLRLLPLKVITCKSSDLAKKERMNLNCIEMSFTFQKTGILSELR